MLRPLYMMKHKAVGASLPWPYTPAHPHLSHGMVAAGTPAAALPAEPFGGAAGQGRAGTAAAQQACMLALGVSLLQAYCCLGEAG